MIMDHSFYFLLPALAISLDLICFSRNKAANTIFLRESSKSEAGSSRCYYLHVGGQREKM
jgi:hypothetical protein